MPETLLAATGVKLFGRLVDGLTYDPAAAGGSLGGALKALPAGTGADAPRFARVYGFSFEGQYHDLARPALFLVHDEGTPAAQAVEQTGVGIREPELAADLLVWSYDRDDFLLRVDVEAGPLERILLEAELGPDGLRAGYAGQTARLNYAGQTARLRYAGQTARLQGGRGGGLSD